ncbi:MAG: DMT family transporter [Spirochaetales bacterium]|nr:DMT family transporter [Spirochaetales bacterium]MCF7939406.1 DMT family transporter [Spirochaetales bacterium]
MKAILMNLTSILAWSLSPVLIRLVRDDFPIQFQNFFRFSISLAVVWVVVMRKNNPGVLRERFRADRRLPLKYAGLALFVFLHQFFLVAGIYRIMPGIASILEESGLLFSIVLALIFFADERAMIRHPLFVPGIVLSLVGVTLSLGLTEMPFFSQLFSHGEGGAQALQAAAGSGAAFGGAGDMGEFYLGGLFIILSALSWSMFSVLIKHWLPGVPGGLSTAMVFTIIVPFFFLTHLFTALAIPGMPIIPHPSGIAWLYLSLSGLVGIALGYSFYYISLPVIGVTLAANLGLLIPFFTAVISFIILGERLTPLQLVGGVVLISGCILLAQIRLKRKSVERGVKRGDVR